MNNQSVLSRFMSNKFILLIVAIIAAGLMIFIGILLSNDTTTISGQISNQDESRSIDLRVIYYGEDIAAGPVGFADFFDVQTDENGVFTVPISDTEVDGASRVRLCVNDELDTAFGEFGNDEEDGLAVCRDTADQDALSFDIASCDIYPVTKVNDGLLGAFKSSNSELIVGSFCNRNLVIINEDGTTQEDMAATGDQRELVLRDNLLTLGDSSVDLSELDLEGDDEEANEATGDTFIINNIIEETIVEGSEDSLPQTLTLSGDSLRISGGNTIDLSKYLDDTDSDTFAGFSCDSNEVLTASGSTWVCTSVGALTGETLTSITVSGSVITYTDENLASVNIDIQDLETTSTLVDNGNNTFTYTNEDGAFVTIADVDEQTLTIAGNTLTLGNGTGPDTTVDLSSYLDNTDSQDLTLSGNVLSLTNDGTTVDLSGYLDNTDAQTIALSSNIITLSNGTAGDTTVNLTPYLDNTDDQVLTATLSGTDLELTLEDGGGTQTVDLSSLAGGTDDQMLTLLGTDLSIEDGNNVSLASFLDNTDNQDLSLAGNTLSLTNDGTPVDLSVYLDDTTLTEGAVDAFVSNNGYLTAEVDGSTSNEIQALSLTGNTLSLSLGGGSESLAAYLDNTDSQDLTLTGNTLALTNDGTTVDLSSYLDNTDELAGLSCSPTEIAKWNGAAWACAADDVNDADSNATNELQDISLAGNDLSIDSGSTIDLSGYLDNTDAQDLSLTGNTLALTNDGTTVDLSSYLDNTDELAGLSCSPNEIAKWNGAAWACAADVDTTIADDQTIALAANILTLGNGDGADTTADLSIYLDNTDAQDLALSGNTLSLTNDGTTVDLATYLDNTDNQALSISGNNLELTSDDGTDTVDLSGYLDNTDNQDLSLSGNTLSLTNDGTTVDLSGFLDNTDTLAALSCSPNQIAEWNGAAWACLTPTNTNTDNQQIALAANVLTLSNGTGADTTANFSAYLDNTDNQDLTLTGNTLSLTNDGTTVDLSGYLDNTDSQDISLAGTDLSIDSGSTIDLSVINTDSQDLTLTGNTLALTNDGTTVDLSSYLDNTDELAGLSCSPTEIAKWNGAAWACAADDVNDADSNATNELQDISLAGNDLSIDSGSTIDLSGYLDNTDAQDLSLTGNTLALTNDGTTVDLSSYLDNTDELAGLSCSPNEIAKWNGAAWACAADVDTTIADDQTIALAANILTLGNGDGADTTADLSIYLDNTDAQDLALSGNTLSLTNDGTTVDLATYLDNTDNQALSISGNNLELTSDDGTDTVDLSGYLDNTDNQDLSLSGNTLSLTNDGTTVDLSGFLDNTDTLAALSCSPNQIAEWNGAAWACLTPTNTNTDNQQIALAANVLTLSNGTGADTTANFSAYLDNTDNQDLTLTGNTLSLTNDGTTVDLSGYLDNTDSQDISLAGTDLSIDSGSTIDLSVINTDSQDLTLTGNTLALTNDGTTVDLSSYLDNTDELAGLSCSPTEIAKWNGAAWACAADDVNDADSNATNELQDISLAGNDLSIDSGSTIDLSGYLDNTDAQDLSLTGNTLALTNDGTTVDLSSYLDNTDELAGLSCSPNEIAKWNGAAWACAADVDTTIADDQTIALAANILTLGNGDGADTTADLSIYLDNTDAQDLALSGNTLSLTNDGTTVDLATYLDNTDNQALSISGNNLELTSDDGTDTVDLSGYLDNTDNQDLSLSGNTLSLTNDGTTVDLSGFLDNTDNQDLSLSGNTLSLTNDGTTVDLSPYLDNTDALAGLSCSPTEIAKWNGAAWACAADVVDDADNNATNELQDISLAGTDLSIDSGSTIDLSFLQDSLWTDAGTYNYLTSAEDVVIGATTDQGARFAVVGNADETQVEITANAAQTSPIIVVNEGSGAELFRIDSCDSGTFNSLNSLFIGYEAGADDDCTTNRGVGIGAQALTNNTSGDRNTAVGVSTLEANTTGSRNVAVGWAALTSNDNGGSNVAVGTSALAQNLSGSNNSAFGRFALEANTTNSGLSAFGYFALSNNTLGTENSAFGFQSLTNNVNGSANVAFGYEALESNSSASDNLAVGVRALGSSNASRNIAVGNEALRFNSGGDNVGLGISALNTVSGSGNLSLGNFSGLSTTTGNQNVIAGFDALRNNVSGSENVIIGYQAARGTGLGSSSSDNVFIGHFAGNVIDSADFNVAVGSGAALALTTGQNNVLLGASVGDTLTTGSGNIVIGTDVDLAATTSNTLNLGNIIYGTGINQTGFTVDTDAQIGIGDQTPDTGTSTLKLDVEGAVGATEYCDEDGNNCTTPTVVSTLASNAFVQNGNDFGGTAVLGTTSTDSLQFIVGNNTAATIVNGGAINFTNQTNSDAAFEVNAVGGTDIFIVDSNNQKVAVGKYVEGSIAGALQVTPQNDDRAGLVVVENSATYGANFFEARDASGNIPFRVDAPDDLRGGATKIGSNGGATSGDSIPVWISSGGTDSSNTTGSSGAVYIDSGDGRGTNGSSGDIVIDSGDANGTGTTGNVLIGGVNADLIDLGNTTSTVSVNDDLFVDGNLGVGDTTPDVGEQALRLDVAGAIGGSHYCDQLGNNCVAAAALGSGSSLWTDGGTYNYLTSAEDVVVGATTDQSARFAVVGDSDEVQLKIQNNSTQTSPSILVDNSAGTELFRITSCNEANENNSVYFGFESGINDDCTSNRNLGFGSSTLRSTTTGYNNIAIGSQALDINTSGYRNIAIGEDSLSNNTIGHRNTAIGSDTLFALTDGDYNTGIASEALAGVTTGNRNSAFGYGAGDSIVGGNNNTVIGYEVDLGASDSNKLNVGNVIYGLNVDQTGYTIDADALIGIGEQTPGARLHVTEETNTVVLRLEDSDGTCDLNPNSGGSTFSCTSDGRLKSDITNAQSTLEYLTGIEVREYTVDASGDRLTGVIAQELLVTHPELVYMGNDGYYRVNEISNWQLVKGIQELEQITSDNAEGIETQALRIDSSEEVIADNTSSITINSSSIDSLDEAVEVITVDLTGLDSRLATIEAFDLDNFANTLVDLEERVSVLEAAGTGDSAIDGHIRIDSANDLAFISNITFEEDVTFQEDVAVLGDISLNSDQVGQATVEAGQTSVDVVFDGTFEDKPFVTITIEDDNVFTNYNVSDVTSSGFTINIEDLQTADLTINWQAFPQTD